MRGDGPWRNQENWEALWRPWVRQSLDSSGVRGGPAIFTLGLNGKIGSVIFLQTAFWQPVVNGGSAVWVVGRRFLDDYEFFEGSLICGSAFSGMP